MLNLLRSMGVVLVCGLLGCASDSGGTGESSGTSEESGGESTGETGGMSEGCEPILNQAMLDTGFESCDDGTKRRRAVLECPTEQTSPMSPCMDSNCTSDADCVDQPGGYCANAHNLTGYCGCFYGCRNDSECDAGSICECGVVVGQCVPAACTTNQDCGSGFGCVATYEGAAGDPCTDNPASSYVCQTAADECSSDMDCPGTGPNPGACFLDGDHRACGTICAQTP